MPAPGLTEPTVFMAQLRGRGRFSLLEPADCFRRVEPAGRTPRPRAQPVPFRSTPATDTTDSAGAGHWE